MSRRDPWLDNAKLLLVALVVVVVAGVAGVLLARAERPPHPVGFMRIVVADPQDRPLEAGVWVRCVDVKRGLPIVRKMEEAVDLAGIDPYAAPPAGAPAAPPASAPPPEPPKKDDFDDFDIGLDRT